MLRGSKVKDTMGGRSCGGGDIRGSEVGYWLAIGGDLGGPL